MKWIGIVAAIALIVACFFPWVFIESKNITVTGIESTGTSFGKPAYVHFFLAPIYLLFSFIPKVWAKRWNLLIVALNIAWAARNYFIISACSGGAGDRTRRQARDHGRPAPPEVHRPGRRREPAPASSRVAANQERHRGHRIGRPCHQGRFGNSHKSLHPPSAGESFHGCGRVRPRPLGGTTADQTDSRIPCAVRFRPAQVHRGNLWDDRDVPGAGSYCADMGAEAPRRSESAFFCLLRSES